MQLNKNSGSDEALNPNGAAAEPISAEVDEIYGYEYGDEDYGAQQEQPQPEAPEQEVQVVEEEPPKAAAEPPQTAIEEA